MAFDVCICGGGLAGLTLALQVRRRLPDASIVVLERARRPLPEACHKVGESTVEVGGRYFGHDLGLRSYLLERHLPKNGLRFFCGDSSLPLDQRSEMGPPEPPSVPAYQIDRGRFENDLRARCEDDGIDLREGWGVREIDLSSDGSPHRVVAIPTRQDGKPVDVEARWVIDATGRRRMLVKQLGLHEDLPRQASSSWFRVAEQVKIADLASEDAREWHERDVDDNRWLSTNHLCGEGYWVWIIPLSSGHTSIGIAAEASSHEYTTFSTEEATRAWLRQHEPTLAARLDGVPFADFIAMKDYRYFASRIASADRWACVGEAGLFVDPLYSPGSDMIALSNTIATELIVDDLTGELDPARVEALDAFFRDFARIAQRTLCLGSRVMGSPDVYAAKLYWDYFQYWAFISPYFFQRIYRLPLDEHARFHRMLHRFAALNERAQRVLQAWTDIGEPDVTQPFVGLPAIATTLSDLHLELLVDKDPDATYAAMEEAHGWGEELVWELYLRALRHAGPERASELAAKIGLGDWTISETRLDADETEKRKRRKLLSKPIRDMERSIGKNATPGDGAPTLRELWHATGAS